MLNQGGVIPFGWIEFIASIVIYGMENVGTHLNAIQGETMSCHRPHCYPLCGSFELDLISIDAGRNKNKANYSGNEVAVAMVSFSQLTLMDKLLNFLIQM